MGILNLLENFRDLFEIGRKTVSEEKDNKPKKRNYNFQDGEKIPTTRLEYQKTKKTPKKVVKDERDLEL